MGIEIGLIIAGISAVVGIAGAVAQADAAAKSAAAQKEVKDIQLAQGKVQTLESRRQKLREERIRRARIMAAAENTGTGSSSGASGSVSALSTNLQGLVASASGQSRANEGINRNNQKAIDFDQQARTIGAFTGAIQGGLSSFKTIFDD